jgi:hypothetical protein
MKPSRSLLITGLACIIAGALFLLETLQVWDMDEILVTAIIFWAAGLSLLTGYFGFSARKGALITGAVCLFIGTTIWIINFTGLPDYTNTILFLIITGLVFLEALRRGKKNWWAVLPGGMCLVFAGQVLADNVWNDSGTLQAGLFFGGVGIVFGIVYLLRDETHPLGWARYPSLIALVLALLFLVSGLLRGGFWRLVFPLALIAAGCLIIRRSLTKRPISQK